MVGHVAIAALWVALIAFGLGWALMIEGDATAPTFTRVHASNYKNAAFAVETARALHDLGFKAHEVKQAMAQARTHVGTSDLPLEEWIRIGLRFARSQVHRSPRRAHRHAR